MPQLAVDILPQPTLTTCGPTCLHAVYRYFGGTASLEQVIDETQELRDGGTLAVLLGCHALERGWQATIYTYNLEVFDPTWFDAWGAGPRTKSARAAAERVRERLALQAAAKDNPRLRIACQAYRDYLKLGGSIRMEDLSEGLIRRHLRRGAPILTGLSSTYLYRDPREVGASCAPDDIQGTPAGHFVVLCGYDAVRRTVRVADPFEPNPLGGKHHYTVGLDRLVCAILLGVLTYDANLLVVEPPVETDRCGLGSDHRLVVIPQDA